MTIEEQTRDDLIKYRLDQAEVLLLYSDMKSFIEQIEAFISASNI